MKFPHIVLILLLSWLSLLQSALAAETAVSTTWVYPDRDYRMPLTVSANGHERLNKVVEFDVDFATALTDLSATGSFDEESVRVAEVSSAGALIDSEVPFQFDNGNTQDAPLGTLIFLMDGTTLAGNSRYFQIYFDTTGSFSAPAAMTDLVDRQSNSGYRGQNSFIIETKDDASTVNSTYYYHKKGGGFASIYDRDGNDWISYYNSANSKSGGEYRGIPNLGDVFHPGYNDPSGDSMKSTSTVLEDGPLRLSIRSISHNGEWTARWDIFPTYARMTILDIPNSDEYWFLYEGTPGGNLEYTGGTQDIVVRSDGDSNNAGETWDVADQELEAFSPSAPGEWIYVADSATERILYIAHSNDDAEPDSYRPQRDNDQTPPSGPPDNGAMTVFGYGRKTTTGVNRHLTALNATFTIGFGESNVLNEATAVIHGASQALTISISNEAPLVDINDGFGVNEGASATFSNTQLASSDPEGGPITYEVDTPPTNGVLYLNASPLTGGSQFTQDDIDSGKFSYSHGGNELSSDSFSLLPKDNIQSGALFTVLILVNGVNDAPVANSDIANAASGLGTPAIIDVLQNDTDVDNTILSIQSITQPTNGVTVINGDNTISYAPSVNFEGSDSFTYIITDGNLPSAPTTVLVTVEKAKLLFLPLVVK